MAKSTANSKGPSQWAVCEKGSPYCIIVVESRERAEELASSKQGFPMEVREVISWEPLKKRRKR